MAFAGCGELSLIFLMSGMLKKIMNPQGADSVEMSLTIWLPCVLNEPNRAGRPAFGV